jgi:L-fucose isomerase-like protein
MRPVTFALFFGNRGFFPEALIAGARREMQAVLKEAGYDALMLDAGATRYGAVESPEEGRTYARFLDEHRGRFDGVILCLPNFGDETGAVAALQDAGVPILVHAYPDEKDRMGFQHRRDAFCGKFSVMDVLSQYGVPFTTFQPHTVAPSTAEFRKHLGWFAAVCRVVRRMRRLTIGAIGARTTAFKTIRFDELTLQHAGITTETLDLSDVFLRVREVKERSDAFRAKAQRLRACTRWQGVPDVKFSCLVRLSVVLDDLIREYAMDAIALRCWIEIERELGVAPCILLGELNDCGIPAACELDVCNAVAMTALAAASEKAATCLDWNNNYGDDPDRCILFHCGPVPPSLMAGKGRVIDHPMFAKAFGNGCGFGCNVGRIARSPMTFCSTKTQDGKLHYYLGEGAFTGEPIAKDFFGCGGVAHIKDLQPKLEVIGHQAYRHHVGVTFGHVAVPVREAFAHYLKYRATEFE